MIHYFQAEDEDEVAKLLRSRGRIVITAPDECDKTSELIRYAEERYPNGRFAVVAQEEKHEYIKKLHWKIYNGITPAHALAKRLLGEELEGDEVMTPYLIRPDAVWTRNFGVSTPVFCDCWNILTDDAKKEIIGRRLFIAATTS